jgi:hypothetical protein
MSLLLRRRVITLVVVPALLVLAVYSLNLISYSKYTRGLHIFLVFLVMADLAAGLRGTWQNVVVAAAATIFGLSAIELGCAALETGYTIDARSLFAWRPVIGWGPTEPGVFRSTKVGAAGLIYDVHYTIDDHLLRRTLSAPSGRTVAFFGDSFTFGEGLEDSQTLPQDYADLTGRKFRVLNFGVIGFGPQQFLRALETGLFDSLLTDTKIFVYETAAWHLERTSCRAGFMVRAPRYELRNGQLVFVGSCAQGWNRVYRDIFADGAAFRRFVRPIANAVGPGDAELYLAEFRRCAELVREKYHARLVVIYISGYDNYLAKTGLADAMIKNRLQQFGIEVIEGELSPKDFPRGTLFTFPGDGHPTAIANRARAVLLNNYLSNPVASSTTSAAE